MTEMELLDQECIANLPMGFRVIDLPSSGITWRDSLFYRTTSFSLD